MSARVLALVILGALAASPLSAQLRPPRFTGADGAVSRIRFRSVSPGADEALAGFAAGAQARFVRGRVTLAASVAQGRLSASDGSAAARSVVEGSLAVSMRPLHWLTVEAGPHLRGYVAPVGTERWVFWQAGARAEGTIVPGVLDVYAAGWLALLSSVNVAPGAAGARGGEAGLTVHVARLPVSVRLAYAVDRAKFSAGARSETFESVFVGLTYTRR